MQFPIADHDDGPDALEMALRLADEFLASPHFTTASATAAGRLGSGNYCRTPHAPREVAYTTTSPTKYILRYL